MKFNAIVLLVICIAATAVAGCTTNPSQPVGTSPVPTTLPQVTPIATTAPVQPAECTRAEDCVPSECCHPSSCTAVAVKKPCNLMCTASCEGPLDCGAGSCGCVRGKCSVVPASTSSAVPQVLTGITVNASPRLYSPVMSSTPGVRLEPVVTGFSAGNATFAWKASYGRFLSWNAPDYQINQQGDSVTNHGEKLYWSFTDKPSSTTTPVTITVTATDTASGNILGSSVVTLDWADNYSVSVRGG